MKKLLFGLIAIVMFTNLSFGQVKIAYSDFGFYHNEALSLLEKNRSEWIGMDTNQTIDYLSKLMASKYPEQFSSVDVTNAKKIFEGYKYNNFSYADFVLVWNSNKESLYSENNLPKRTGVIIDKIIANNLTYEQTLNEITTAKKVKGLTENELNSLTAMESLLNSSYNYWNSYSNTTSKRKSGAWIVDICVGVFFAESGPLSIIAGGLASQFCSETGQ